MASFMDGTMVHPTSQTTVTSHGTSHGHIVSVVDEPTGYATVVMVNPTD